MKRNSRMKKQPIKDPEKFTQELNKKTRYPEAGRSKGENAGAETKKREMPGNAAKQYILRQPK